jgi:excisionase family DNA binding protein
MIPKHLVAPLPSQNALNRPIPRMLAADDQAAALVRATLAPRQSDAVLHTIDEVAVKLRMCRKSVQRLIKSGKIIKAPIGGRLVRISSEELLRLTTGKRL